MSVVEGGDSTLVAAAITPSIHTNTVSVAGESDKAQTDVSDINRNLVVCSGDNNAKDPPVEVIIQRFTSQR